MQETELSRGLNPAPPAFAKTAAGDPAHHFWVIKHGIKMSGMAAWGKSMEDEYIWGMVAFLERLPRLSPHEYHELVAAMLENLLLAEPIARCAFAGTVPKFSWELPDTPVRKWVAEALELRALLPLVRISTTTELVHVKNDDNKTVVRLRLQSISSPQDQNRALLELCINRFEICAACTIKRFCDVLVARVKLVCQHAHGHRIPTGER
jgi:hypothetical protein